MVVKAMAMIAALAAAASAVAVEVDGVRLADKATVDGQELVLNGAGTRKRAIFKVYVGSLYLPAKARSAQEVLAKSPRRVQLNVLRDLSADQLIGALTDGLKQNTTPAELSAITVQTGELAAIMKSFGEAKEGSVGVPDRKTCWKSPESATGSVVLGAPSSMVSQKPMSLRSSGTSIVPPTSTASWNGSAASRPVARPITGLSSRLCCGPRSSGGMNGYCRQSPPPGLTP